MVGEHRTTHTGAGLSVRGNSHIFIILYIVYMYIDSLVKQIKYDESDGIGEGYGQRMFDDVCM